MDLNTGLTQALSDRTNNYIYGLDRIAQMNTATEYFLGDALGSVRQITNTTGAITYASAYDPYGVVASTSGSSQTSYGYTNEYTSQGLIYLRSRVYFPESGRFTTKDTWEGDVNYPLSLNKWNYVEGNPINFVDPKGRSSVSLNFGTYEDDYDDKHRSVPHWTNKEAYTVETALGRIAWAYANAYNKEAARRVSEECDPILNAVLLEKIDPFTAFHKVHGGRVTFKWNSFGANGYWGRAISPQKVWFYSNTPKDLLSSYIGQRFVTHEMGHVFENAYSEVYQQYTGTDKEYKPARNLVATNNNLNNRNGFAGVFLDWQWSNDSSSGEIFADMFVGWVFNSWALSPTVPLSDNRYKQQNENYLFGLSKSEFMMEYMPIWIYDTIQHRL